MSTFGSVKTNLHTLHFRSNNELVGAWQAMLSQRSYAQSEIAILYAEGAQPTTPPPTRKRTMSRPDFPAGPATTQPPDLIRVRNEVARRLKQVARAILHQLANPQGPPGPVEPRWVQLFSPSLNLMRKSFSPVAGQGFVVAGTYAEEVRIRDNSVDDAIEAIHVGFSHRDTYHRNQPDQGHARPDHRATASASRCRPTSSASVTESSSVTRTASPSRAITSWSTASPIVAASRRCGCSATTASWCAWSATTASRRRRRCA